MPTLTASPWRQPSVLSSGVAEGVAEVELAPLARLRARRGRPPPALMATESPTSCSIDRRIERQRRRGVGLQEREQPGVGDQGVLDDLRHAVDHFRLRQRAQHVQVAEHEFGLVEGSDQVLVAFQVDPVLAAHAGVDLGQQGRGDEAEPQPAQERRGDEPGDVADHAAADPQDEGADRLPDGGRRFVEVRRPSRGS